MLTVKKIQRVLFLLAFMMVVSFFTSPAAFSSGAVFLLVKGKVSITLHRATFPAKTGLRIQSGVTVTSLGGTASILLSDGTVVLVEEGPGTAIPETVGDDSRDPLITDLMDTIRETAHRGRAPTTETGEENEKVIIPVYPCNSFLTSEELRFEWEGMGGMEEMEISLKSPSPVFQYAFKWVGDEDKALLPEGAPSLIPDIKYYWRVRGFHKTGGEPYASRLSWFAVLGKERSDALQTELERIGRVGLLDEDNLTFLRAHLYISHGLHHRALDLLRRQFEKFPQDVGLKEILVGVLLRMKKNEEALKIH